MIEPTLGRCGGAFVRRVCAALKLRNECVSRLRIVDGVEHHHEQTGIAFGRFAALVWTDVDPLARGDVPAAAAEHAAVAAQVTPGRFVSTMWCVRHAAIVDDFRGMRVVNR
ncbi:MAG TPA: hypothetical protein VMJ74_07060 [Pseudomonadales bacterium]|nr:hypothetical protein [Pseudomonadales bacterium]